MVRDHRQVAKVKLLVFRDFEESYPCSAEGSNEMHLFVKVDKME
jgi:hypothetical protein